MYVPLIFAYTCSLFHSLLAQILLIVFLHLFHCVKLVLNQIQFIDTAYLGVVTGALALAVTVVVDSIFWKM